MSDLLLGGAIGFVAGIRSLVAPAVLSREIARGRLLEPRGALAVLGSPAVPRSSR